MLFTRNHLLSSLTIIVDDTLLLFLESSKRTCVALDIFMSFDDVLMHELKCNKCYIAFCRICVGHLKQTYIVHAS